MNEQQRIEVLVKKVGSGKKLAEKIGTSDASVSKLRMGTFHIEAFAVRIAQAFPDLNCRWLLTGEGSPWAKEAKDGKLNKKLDEILDILKKK